MIMARFPVSRYILLCVGLLGFLWATLPNSRASSNERMEAGPAAAQAWLNQIDAAQYEESYQAACSPMHDKVTMQKWVEVLKTFRSHWGKVMNRKQISHIYKANGVEGLSGECMVLTYDTSFQKLDPAQEIVVLRWEDGKWRGAGYTAGPKVSPEDAAAADDTAGMPQTETSTRTTTKPQQ